MVYPLDNKSLSQKQLVLQKQQFILLGCYQGEASPRINFEDVSKAMFTATHY